jgi:ferric-dicitrate binding protein FerR (iron transport regulator)
MTDPLSTYPLKEAARITYLVEAYIRNTITPAEHHELDEWVIQSDANMDVFDQLTSTENANRVLAKNIHQVPPFTKTKKNIPQRENRRTVLIRMIPYAAAAVLVLIAGTWAFNYFGKNRSLTAIDTICQPARNIATIRLSDGNTYSSEDSTTLEKGLTINAAGNMFMHDTTSGTDTTRYLLSIPPGGKYGARLNDGTIVRLNAASSLSYPRNFTGGFRTVRLTGEGYFEVAKNTTQPFIVLVGNQLVRVVGTKFNVNAGNEQSPVITAVTEGIVNLETGTSTMPLRAGQLGSMSEWGSVGSTPVKMDEALAWTNDQFIFRNAPIQSIMNEVARSYGAKIRYNSTPGNTFNLNISRTSKLSTVLQQLQSTQHVKFKIKDSLIIISQ